MDSTIPSVAIGLKQAEGAQSQATPKPSKTDDVAFRFEQMLWAEMLSHAGFEDALTMSGGEAASSFSRYVVEAVAKDLAEQHSFGFRERIFPAEYEQARKVVE